MVSSPVENKEEAELAGDDPVVCFSDVLIQMLELYTDPVMLR